MKLLLTTIAVTSLVASTSFADPIHDATKAGDIAGVQAELDKGVDVNKKDKAEMTPLHPAAANGHKEIAELLIDNGADVNAKDRWGMTPLHWAARKGHKEVAELLLTKGADVNAKANDGTTPIDWAIQKSRTETADLLRKFALMPRLTYSRGLFDFSFTAKNGMTYVVEVTQDFKQWGELETIEGTGKQVKFNDPRQPLVPFKRNFYRVKAVE